MTVEFELEKPPSDGISCVEFSKFSTRFLLATSWDGKTRIYDAQENQLVKEFDQGRPVLDGTFISNEEIVCGGLDEQLTIWDINSGAKTTLAVFENAVKSVVYNFDFQCVVAGSWDRTVKFVDPRSNQSTISLDAEERVYTMDSVHEKVVVGMANRIIKVYDVRKPDVPLQHRESSLRNQTRCIRCVPNGDGFVTSSIEGRVAVEFFDPSTESQQKKYAFKCHRQTIDNVESIYPVNALAFHPIYGTFATGGSDGVVNMWDRINKKKIKPLIKCPTTIASLSFSVDGSMLAVASSYVYDEGEKDHPFDSIYIKQLEQQDVMPKLK